MAKAAMMVNRMTVPLIKSLDFFIIAYLCFEGNKVVVTVRMTYNRQGHKKINFGNK